MSHPGNTPLYDAIGEGYATTRQADPRIAAAIERALGDARTILNVGAGAGSYEPADREVTAVEPSAARPEAYLDPTIRDGMSGMRQLGPAMVEPAVERLAADLDSGAWDRRHGDLRDLEELDLGYRLVVARI